MELRAAEPAELRTLYERDLRASFPPAELKPLTAMERLERRGRYRPYCYADGGRILGECFLWLGEPGWALLDYLCVSPPARGAGVGAKMLGALRKAENGVIFWESEAPEHAPDRAMAERRLTFYRRNGARLAGYDTEAFGVHYRTLYLADGAVADDALLRRHRAIYQDCFPPEKFIRYLRIPRAPDALPGEQVPWSE